PSIPVMVLTSKDTFTDRVEVARRGGRGFLPRSSPASKIAEAAAQLLGRLHAEDNRILAVDDDPQVLSFLRSLFESRGLRIDTLDDPLQFWERLEAAAPDLLLLDVDMPHLSGVELCRVVRNDPRWSETPILFLTRYNNPETIDRVFSAGADDFVPKPVVGPELLTRVFNRLEQTRLRKSMMETDSLTGALNRSKFSRTLTGFLELARRHTQPAAFALIEIDQLKEINHAQGHGTGDAVMQRIGFLLREGLLGDDAFGRWSGARFAAGMYGLARYDAVLRLNELAEKIQNERFKAADGAGFAVTLSAGIAEYDEDGNDLEGLFKAAERALLEAQKSGGGRVLPASPAAGSEGADRGLDVALLMKDEAQSSLLVNALETLGCRARWFSDGRKAMKLIAGPRPVIRAKVVLLDVELPGMDGLSVLKRLASDGTRVIMLTAPSVQNDAQTALELGAFDCMVKPFN
ncbi:MAG: GGDEF domain-containing response regulator, partial [Terriglobia bacterium]